MSEIDRIRDGAFSLSLSDPSEELLGSVTVDSDSLFFITPVSIYRLLLADDIDPKRVNAKIPNATQLACPAGAGSEIVARTILTAQRLIRTGGYQSEKLPGGQILEECLKIAVALVDVEIKALDFRRCVEVASAGASRSDRRNFSLPSVSGRLDVVKSTVFAIEEVWQHLYAMLSCVFPHRKGMFSGLCSSIQQDQCAAQEFKEFAVGLSEFGARVRNIRNCLAHPKPDHWLECRDFWMNEAGCISPPSVSIKGKDFELHQMDAVRFLQDLLSLTVEYVEASIVHVVFHGIQQSKKMPVGIGIAERRPGMNANVRYACFLQLSDDWHELG